MSTTTGIEIIATPQGTPRTFKFHVEENGLILGQGYDFLWKFGDNTQSVLPQPTKTYPNTESYNVTVDVVEKEGGKEGTDQTGSSGSNTPPPVKSAEKTVFP